MKKANIKRYFQFLLVILASGAIYPLVYLRAQYQETILTVFDMQIQDLNSIYTILGLVFILGYFPSGVLCDKFSAKKLLVVSLLGTSIGGFWFAQVPSYNGVIFVFVIWGIFSVLTFWSAHLKMVKMLSTPEEEGRFFGFLDSGKGLVEAALASIALVIFTGILGSSTEVAVQKEALVAIIYMYSFVLLITSVLIFIFVKEDKDRIANDSEAENKFNFRDLGQVFKNKYVFMHGIILFAGYVLFWTNYYFGGYLQTVVGVNPATVGTIMVGVLWMRPIGGVIGGFLADKIGRAISIAISLVVAAVSIAVLALAPIGLPVPFFGALIIITGLMLYILRGTYWSLIGESKINIAVMGTAIGLVSLIGYLPDIILPQLNSFLWNNFDEITANKAYFLISVGVGLVGAVIALLFRKIQKAEANKA
jgi:MFS family permease